MSTAATDTPRRRRLWQLPAELRSLLVGLGLPPAVLRRCTEQALGRLHRSRVQLAGSDADVLASVLCDLGSRNAVAEAVQAQLAQRHAAWQARLAPLRDAQALREAWRSALEGADAPGAAWAVLTHPSGGELDDALLVDLRGWAMAQAWAAARRQGDEATLRQALQQARAEADGLRLRLQQALADHGRARDAWARALARQRGECAALRERLSAPPAAAAARRQLPAAVAAERGAEAIPADAWRAAAPAPAPACAPPGGCAAARRAASPSPAQGEPAGATPRAFEHASPAPAQGDDTGAEAALAARGPLALRGRRVLCVGGMPGAQSRYRELVENAGACFDFHDGGIEQGLHRLDRQLGAADLVVCQAGCLNHEAYRRVKGHCRRLTKPCLFVARPSLALFARTLGLGAADDTAAASPAVG